MQLAEPQPAQAMLVDSLNEVQLVRAKRKLSHQAIRLVHKRAQAAAEEAGLELAVLGREAAKVLSLGRQSQKSGQIAYVDASVSVLLQILRALLKCVAMPICSTI